jgi:hypothetical protein
MATEKSRKFQFDSQTVTHNSILIRTPMTLVLSCTPENVKHSQRRINKIISTDKFFTNTQVQNYFNFVDGRLQASYLKVEKMLNRFIINDSARDEILKHLTANKKKLTKNWIDNFQNFTMEFSDFEVQSAPENNIQQWNVFGPRHIGPKAFSKSENIRESKFNWDQFFNRSQPINSQFVAPSDVSFDEACECAPMQMQSMNY